MRNGTVKWFNEGKGFGFITSQGEDYFVHIKEIKNHGISSLKEGDKVSFDPSSSPKGLIAKEVTVIL